MSIKFRFSIRVLLILVLLLSVATVYFTSPTSVKVYSNSNRISSDMCFAPGLDVDVYAIDENGGGATMIAEKCPILARDLFPDDEKESFLKLQVSWGQKVRILFCDKKSVGERPESPMKWWEMRDDNSAKE